MTIDEAIEHAIQVADSYKDTVPDCDCARDHRQLAEWLRQARDAESRVQELERENTELRKLAQEACEMTGNLLDDLSNLHKEFGIEV